MPPSLEGGIIHWILENIMSRIGLYLHECCRQECKYRAKQMQPWDCISTRGDTITQCITGGGGHINTSLFRSPLIFYGNDILLSTNFVVSTFS